MHHAVQSSSDFRQTSSLLQQKTIVQISSTTSSHLVCVQNDTVDVMGPAGMMELLRVAADESQPEPWPRVHAINTLRLTFNDKNLANDVSGFFAQGNVHESHLFA